MRIDRLVPLGLFAGIFSFFCVSCAHPKPSDVRGFSGDGAALEVTAEDEASVSGSLPLGRAGRLRYSMPRKIELSDFGALELEYECGKLPDGTMVLFTVPGEPSWALPSDAGFLGFPSAGNRLIRYRFPVSAKTVGAFGLEVRSAKGAAPDAGSVKLLSVRASERAYGFDLSGDAPFMTPFVYHELLGDAHRFVIDPSAEFKAMGNTALRIGPASISGKLFAADEEYRCRGIAGSTPQSVMSFAPASLPSSPYPIVFETHAVPASFLVQPLAVPPFPEQPIAADPGLILHYRREAWRDARYEVFRWERFPSILIFDTADYAVQERLFKRLAFFVEKAGFRGHLASDGDIAALHGWNAHDYRAEDLAAFFQTAQQTKFPLNAEEIELRRILLASGLMKSEKRSDGTEAFTAGVGALVSISRESADYLRNLFMTHECLHGIFFIDAEFRSFASERYAELKSEPKTFLKAYFDSRRYDVSDKYLMINELMAYCLQQPTDQAVKYFGDTLPVRLEKDEWRKKSLPPKSTGDVPYRALGESFKEIADKFDAYIDSRWGIRAGRIGTVYQISRTKAAR